MSTNKNRGIKYKDGKKNPILRIVERKMARDMNDDDKGKRISGRKLTRPHKLDTLSSDSLYFLKNGFRFLERCSSIGLDHAFDQIMTGQRDVSKNTMLLLNSKDFISETLSHISNLLYYKADSVEFIEKLVIQKVLCDLAEEGMIIEKVNNTDGTSTEQLVSPKKITDAYDEYDYYRRMLQDRTMTLMAGLGMCCISVLGAMYEDSDKCDKKNRYKDFSIVTLTTIATTAIRIVQDLVYEKVHDSDKELWNEQRDRVYDYLNGTSSEADSKDQFEGIENVLEERMSMVYKYRNKDYALDTILNVFKIIAAGIYINNHAETNEQGDKYIGRSISGALVRMVGSRNQAGNIVSAGIKIPEIRKLIKDYIKAKQKVDYYESIYNQYLELKGADTEFNSFTITNFKGNFHPREDEDTNKVNYLVKLDIDRFEAKKGDLILITGDSGSGKSTFLRLLKLGDFNKDNQQQIILDNGQMVDHLGNQFIYLNPEFSFTDEDSVLLQMTGKKKVEDLTADEKNRLLSVLESLELKQQIYDKICNAKNIDNSSQKADDAQVGKEVLDYLSKAVNQEFSLGQERRLALTKIFYRDLDPASVLIFDEPANNVEDELALKEFELMAEYAKKRDMILIFTTHNKAAQKIATKCYNMDSGVLRLVDDKIKPNTGSKSEEHEFE